MIEFIEKIDRKNVRLMVELRFNDYGVDITLSDANNDRLQTLATLNPDGTLSLHSLNSCIAHDWGMQLDYCGRVKVELTSEEV